MNKINVIHVFWSFTKGGAEYLVKEISENLKDTFNQHIIIINNHYDTDLINSFDPSIKFYLINRERKSFGLTKLLMIYRIIYELKNKIIHAHNYSLGYILFPFFGLRKILTIHGFDSKLNSYKFFDKVVCVSSPLSNYVTSNFNLKNICINNGVNNKLIKIKKKFNKSIKLLFIGRFDNNIKGLDILLEAFNLLSKKEDKITLSVIGEGNKKDEFTRFVELNNLNDKIFFRGSLPRAKIYKIISNFDISIIPSRKESFSLFAVESMMAKVPVIASKIPGLSDVVGSNSSFFENENANDLCDKISELILEIKSDKIISRIEKSYKYSTEELNIEKMINSYSNLYLNNESTSGNK